MVGTPKSTGCQTCRKRKKKCDEQLPACSECVRAGWLCPGYDRRWKFVDENKQLVRKQRKTHRAGTRPLGASGAVGTESGTPAHSQSKAGDRRLVFYKAQRLGNAVCHAGIFWPLNSETDRHAALFVSLIGNDRAQSLFPLQAVGSFLPSIPARLGRNAALDATIASLCSIYVDFLTGKKTVGSNATVQKYIAALRALQDCIDDACLRLQSETICAAIIIQMCELMISPDSDQWRGLNRGCALLFRDCDPERFRTGFDRDLLDSQRTHFLSQSMHVPEQCFLARPEWRAIDRAPTGPSAYGSEESHLKNTLSNLLMDLPGMIREAADLVKSQRTQRGRKDHQLALEDAICRLVRLKQKLEKWFATLSLKTGSGLATTDGQWHPPKQRYRNFFCGIVDCVVSTVLVKLDRMVLCLASFLHPADHTLLHLTLSPELLRAIEERRNTSLEAFALVKSTSDVGIKPLALGLKMIATDDDLFEVTLPDARLPYTLPPAASVALPPPGNNEQEVGNH